MEKLNETILSPEQNENEQNLEKFSDIMSTIRESISEFERQSDEAQEIATSIDDFKNEFEKNGLKLENYQLGNVLLYKKDGLAGNTGLPLDTKGKEIEKEILDLKAKQEERLFLEKTAA